MFWAKHSHGRLKKLIWKYSKAQDGVCTVPRRQRLGMCYEPKTGLRLSSYYKGCKWKQLRMKSQMDALRKYIWHLDAPVKCAAPSFLSNYLCTQISWKVVSWYFRKCSCMHKILNLSAISKIETSCKNSLFYFPTC